MRKRTFPQLALLVLLTTGVGWVSPPEAAAETAGTIEELVVTSQRREENLQSVALAVTAFSEEDLRTRGIDSLTEVATRTPGFTMGTFNVAQPQLFIRGIGSNDDGAGADPSVVVFVDEVYVGRSTGSALDLFDLERVEVLRGPQGTLYGKNVVGGAINMVTRKPDETLRARLEGTVGNLDTLRFRGFVSGPLSDNVFGKLAFSSRRRDGYLHSQVDLFPQFFPSSSPDSLAAFEQLEQDTDSIRASLRFVPSDRLELNFSADYSQLEQSGPSTHAIGGVAETVRVGLLPDYVDAIRENLDVDPGVSDREVAGLMGRVDYDFDWGTFTSISAYREADARIDPGNATSELSALLFSSPTAPFGATAFPGNGNTFTDESQQFSQEFRLTSTGDGPIDWVAGLYFLVEDNDRVESFSLGLDLADGAGGVIPFVPESTGTSFMESDGRSYAAFGQATWHATEALGLTLGARYTTEEKEAATRSIAGGFVILESFDVEATESWSEFTPKLSVDYQVTDDVFVYGVVSKGFKSGGFQGTPPVASTAETPYDQEIAWLYEVGVRTEWFDNRLRVNLTAHLTDYEDLQVFQLLIPESAPPDAPGVLTAQNAADAEISGVEVEFVLVPFDNFTLSGSYSYLDAEYSEFTAPSGFRTPGGVDPTQREGNRLRNAPRHAYDVLARYEFPLANGAYLALQADFRHKGRVFQDPDNEAVAAIPEYEVLDGRIAYTTADEQWELALWGKNLTDEDYFLHNFPVSGSGNATPAPPTTYGLTVTWNQ